MMVQETAEVPGGNGEESTSRQLSSKEQIYQVIADEVKEYTGKNIGRARGRIIFDRVIENVFMQLILNREMRLNGGFGSLKMKRYSAGERRLPSGQVVVYPERFKPYYEAGVVVTAMEKNGGDLKAALAERDARRTTRDSTSAKSGKSAPKVPPKEASSEEAEFRGEEFPDDAGDTLLD